LAEVRSRSLQISEFCAKNAANIDKPGTFPTKEFSQIEAAGLLTAPLRTELGGLGLGIESHTTHDLLQLLKQIGSGNLAVGRIYEGHVNALQLVQTFGTAAQIHSYAADAKKGHVFGVWNAEATDGVKFIPTAAGYQLSGSKTFCSGHGYVSRPIVGGALPDGTWQICIVPMEAVETIVDKSWWQPSGMRATASYKTDFSGVNITPKDLLGKPGEYLQQPWLTGGVVRFAAVQLGGAEALLNETRRYLQSLGRVKHPYQEERLGQMAIAVESGNLWLRGAADKLANYSSTFAGTLAEQKTDQQIAQIVAYANMTRSAIEQICMEVIQLCERSVGTRGLLPEHPMERIIRDLSLYLRQPAHDAAIAGVGEQVLARTEPTHALWQIVSKEPSFGPE
jgi:alkylation response protein AidB-like acyl-CoA dehydrogenase